jgi:phosphatidylglycerol:prolipoprotein diacylglycerol transferase
MYPLIEVFGRAIPTYGLCMAAGILVACWIAYTRTRRSGLDVNTWIIIVACAMAVGLLGAKILYLVASCDAGAVMARLSRGDFSDLASGGQVYYGGLLGGVLGAFLGARIAGAAGEFSRYCDAIVPAIPVGHAFGRVGCFLGGCCYGVPWDGWCAVSFPKVGVMEPVFPLQLLEAALNLVLFFVLVMYTRKRRGPYRSLSLYLVLYAAGRFILEFFRGDAIRGVAHGLSTSQWIGIGVLFLGLTRFRWTKRGAGSAKGN